MRVLKIDTPFEGYQAYRFESKNLKFTAYEKDYGRRFIVEDTFDKVAPFHRIVVLNRRDEANKTNPEVKWNAILEEDLKIDQNDIRPKKGNLYQKLESGYDGVHLYFRLMKDPENQKLRNELEQLRISQSLFHSTERYEFDKKEYNLAFSTQKTSKKTVDNLNETYENFKKKLENEKSEIIPDKEKIDYYVERIYFYQTKIKRTNRRIERAEKRYEKAKVDVSRAKSRIDYLNSLMNKKSIIIEENTTVKPLKKILKVETKPVELQKEKTVEPIKIQLIKPINKISKNKKKQDSRNDKNSKKRINCHVYYLMIIAILLGIIGWLLMNSQPAPITSEPTKCPMIEKIVEKECPICEVIVEEKEKIEIEKISVVETILEEIPEEMPSEYKSAENERKIYNREVLNYQKQAPFDFAKVLGNFSKNYLDGNNKQANDIDASIKNFNKVWNNFRRASYYEYYSDDKMLRSDLETNKSLKSQYHNDEKMLYEYSKRYQKMFKTIANQFLKMDCSTACDYVKQIKKEMKILGHPKKKLFLMQQMRKAMQ